MKGQILASTVTLMYVYTYIHMYMYMSKLLCGRAGTYIPRKVTIKLQCRMQEYEAIIPWGLNILRVKILEVFVHKILWIVEVHC